MSTFLQPAATIADIGRQREAVSQKGIDEAIRRFAFEQGAPGQALQQYGNIVAGTILPGTITTTGPGTQGDPLAGAAGTAGIASLLGVTNPMYLAAAALTGGLLSS